ncbi:tetratricopeptide repeat protein [Fibrella forsythiae]|uniref:Tetratricopeptide repeat protein n=1 Tax=Fibrella forsythiae TaxID=2817061 RepID=A0ABS3JFX5_9BACT|nr:tetratricopeptide repeat protein [Fibrella forsythiae]MBO0948909.1 tetratricopeptide repeat protein [Fibrella forsythiae]
MLKNVLRCVLVYMLLMTSAQAQHEAALMQQLTRSLMTSGTYRQPWGHVYYLARLDSAIRAGYEVADHTFWKGLYFLDQKALDKAVPLLEKACRLKPKHHGYVGWVYLNTLRDYPRALAHYDAYDALTPDVDDREGDHAVSFLRSQIYRYMGRHAMALPGYDKAIALVEDKHGPGWVNYRYYVARGCSRLAVGRVADALSDFDKALPNNPSSALVNYWRGRALQLLNRADEARMAYSDALLWLSNSNIEQDQYYEVQDAVYEQQVNQALASLAR